MDSSRTQMLLRCFRMSGLRGMLIPLGFLWADITEPALRERMGEQGCEQHRHLSRWWPLSKERCLLPCLHALSVVLGKPHDLLTTPHKTFPKFPSMPTPLFQVHLLKSPIPLQRWKALRLHFISFACFYCKYSKYGAPVKHLNSCFVNCLRGISGS